MCYFIGKTCPKHKQFTHWPRHIGKEMSNMELTLDTLLFKLNNLNPTALISGNHGKAFNGIKHFRPDASSQSYVYATKLSTLFDSRSPINYSLTFFCINDLGKDSHDIRQHDLNIVLFDGRYELEYVFDRVLDIYDDLAKWDKNMHIHALKGKPPQYLVDMSEGIIEYPMLILDPSFNVLAYTKHIRSNYNFFNETVKCGYTPPDVINTLEKTNLFQQLYKNSEPVVHSAAGSDKLTNIYLKIADKNTIFAYASIFCGDEKPEQGYIDLMKYFFENLGLYFRQSFHTQRSGNYMYESFLQDLLGSKDISLAKIESQLSYIDGLPLRSHFRLIKLEFSSVEGIPLAFIAREIRNNINKARPFIFNGDLYVLREFVEFEKSIKPLTEKELGCLEHILSPYDYSIGISSIFFQITQIKTARIQCEAALKLSSITGGGRVFEYEKCTVYHMIDLAAKEYTVSAFLSHRYLKLREHDSANQTDYCTLLKVYLKNERNTTYTARDLFLHRNTVIYRVQKIQELLNCDLDDVATRIEFHHSFLIQEYLDAVKHIP